MNKLCFFSSLFFLFTQALSAQNETRFYAEAKLPDAKPGAGKLEVTVGEPLQVSFILENGKNNGRFTPPDWEAAGFVVLGSSQSSNISISNGQTSASAVYHYTITPSTAGSLSIPSVSIKNGTETLHSDPIGIEAIPNPEGIHPELPKHRPNQPPSEPKRSFKTIKM